MFPVLALAAQIGSATPQSAPQAPVQFIVKSGQGLNLSVAGIPIVRGSWIQYYEKDWSQGYYSTALTKQTVDQLPNGDFQVKYSSSNGQAFGTETYTKLPDGMKAQFTLGWNGKAPVNVELTGGALWADPIQSGSLTADGKPSRSLSAPSAAADSIEARTYVHSAKDISFDLTAGKLVVHGSDAGWTVYDARNLKQAWTEGKRLFWLGVPALTLAPGETKTTSIEWHFQEKSATPSSSADSYRLPAQSLSEALLPSTTDLPIIPTPKQAMVNRDDPMELPTDIDIDMPAEYPNFGKFLVGEIKRLWDVPLLRTHTGRNTVMYIRVQNLGLDPEGYDIRINRKYAIIQGQDAEGVKHALRTIAQLVFAKDGKLFLPSGSVRDWPSVAWRGAHLFVGPQSVDFHQRLWDKVLLPLKLNHVVLECERVNWDAIKGTESADTMKKADLALFIAVVADPSRL